MLDLTMPIIDGRAVLEACRQCAGRSVSPVIVVSADSGLSHVAPELRGLGVRAYLSKPVDVGVLVGLVDDVVRQAASGCSLSLPNQVGPTTRSGQGRGTHPAQGGGRRASGASAPPLCATACWPAEPLTRTTTLALSRAWPRCPIEGTVDPQESG